MQQIPKVEKLEEESKEPTPKKAPKAADSPKKPINLQRYRIIYAVLTYLTYLSIVGNFIFLSAFSVFPTSLSLIFSLIFLLLAHAETRRLDPTRKSGIKLLDRRFLPDQVYLRRLFYGSLGLIVFGFFATYKSCFLDHVDVGIPVFPGFVYTSALTRFLTMEKVCKVGPPCHVYVTLPFDSARGAIVNI
jgi:hypothetical protein